MSNRFLSLQQEIGHQRLITKRFVRTKTLPVLKKKSDASGKRAVSSSSSIFKYLTHGQALPRKDPRQLTTSAQGIDFIMEWEDFRAMPYNDAEGYCTIGYGHLIARDACEQIAMPPMFENGISEENAVELFKERLVIFETAIRRDITVPLYQHEFDALVSLVFNTGPNFLNTGGVGGGETQIKTHINAQHYHQGADEMADVTNGGVAGLIKRRTAEINMFKNNIYDASH